MNYIDVMKQALAYVNGDVAGGLLGLAEQKQKVIDDLCAAIAEAESQQGLPAPKQYQKMTNVVPPATHVQEWMKPHPKCDEACLFQCTKGFTQFPECATTPASPVQCGFHQEPGELGFLIAKIGRKYFGDEVLNDWNKAAKELIEQHNTLCSKGEPK